MTVLISPHATAADRAYWADRRIPVAADTTVPGRDELDVCEHADDIAWGHLRARHAPRET